MENNTALSKAILNFKFSCGIFLKTHHTCHTQMEVSDDICNFWWNAIFDEQLPNGFSVDHIICLCDIDKGHKKGHVCSILFLCVWQTVKIISLQALPDLKQHWLLGKIFSTRGTSLDYASKNFSSVLKRVIPQQLLHIPLCMSINSQFLHSWGACLVDQIRFIRVWSWLNSVSPPCFQSSIGIPSVPATFSFFCLVMASITSWRVGGDAKFLWQTNCSTSLDTV